MSEKRVGRWGIFSGKSFLNKKRLVAVLIFISLSVNGYALSALEVSKYSLVMLVATVVKGTVTEVFERCDKSLALIANGFCGNMKEVVKDTPFSKEGKEERCGEEEGRGDVGIGVKGVIFNPKEKVSVIKEVYGLLPGRDIDGEKLKEVKEQRSVKTGIYVIIAFLMFIVGILRRKELDDIDETGIKIIKGREISV
jgi:hypothetical protein